MGNARDVWNLCRLALADADGQVAVFRMFMDESGVHDGSPVVCVGAYIARPKVWRDWTLRWNIAKRPIKVFHATDCANLKGEFDGWTREDRDKLVARLLPVIPNTEIRGIVIGIQMHEFEKAMQARPDLRQMIGSPYGACFQWAVGALLNMANDTGNREQIAIIHETNSMRQEALESFAWLQEHAAEGRRLSLQFGTKERFVPLQAADVLAYEGNKRFRDPDRPDRRAWSVITSKIKPLAGYYGARSVPKLIETLDRIKKGQPPIVGPNVGWKRAIFAKAR